MAQNNELASAITVRAGMVGGGILGGFVGYWIGKVSMPGEWVQLWLIAGVAIGFVIAWRVLTWLAGKHRGAGVIAGLVLTLAAIAALLAWFTDWTPS
jgi:hypothetical protein